MYTEYNVYTACFRSYRQTDIISSHHTHGLESIPDSSEHHSEHRAAAAAVRGGGTIHFQLSAHNHQQDQEHQQADKPVKDTATQPLAQVTEPAPVVLYNGPECYVKPKAKSNLQIIRNAICAVCLAGVVNMSLKQKILVVRILTPHPGSPNQRPQRLHNR